MSFSRVLGRRRLPLSLYRGFAGFIQSVSGAARVKPCRRMFSNGAKRNHQQNDATSLGKRLIWVDCEMTGLEIETCHLIEIAVVITEGDLTLVEEGPNIVIHQPDEVLENMNDWCKEHHGKSGLTEAVRKSKISLEQAEYEVLSFIRKYTQPGVSPLAGNSVHVDKIFLNKYMPKFMDHCHYRIVDVSTIKELCRRWYPNVFAVAPIKRASHRATDDIRESIKELQFYRQTLFKNASDIVIPRRDENGQTVCF
ncbi:probable oligoribonuclease [Ptychodera flava]|uniref:probable oligoribonuclease n=1 Tax=Ptychodera flava TaxID=63121 RepID=UPI003969E3AE